MGVRLRSSPAKALGLINFTKPVFRKLETMYEPEVESMSLGL